MRKVPLDIDEGDWGLCAEDRHADEAEHPPMTDAVSCTQPGLTASSALSSISALEPYISCKLTRSEGD